MEDVQNQKDYRNIEIDKVGVKNIRYPIVVMDKKNKRQNTVATINMYVNLPHQFRGTHMSRFIEIMHEHCKEISIKNIRSLLEEMRKKLDAEEAHIEIEFLYFIEKEAPVTKMRSLLDYTCKFIASSNHEEHFILQVSVPVTSLCPCSKEISKYGAHNQRSVVTVQLKSDGLVWIEDVISLVESSVSCEMYPLLKRPDEKYVTEKAYENAMFVEDMIRGIAQRLIQHPKITWFTVEAENFESIHNHNAYGFIERKIK